MERLLGECKLLTNKPGPTAQWVTSGEDWSYGRQPRCKIRQGAMPQGRSRPSSSKRPNTYTLRLPGKWLGERTRWWVSSELRPKVLHAATLVSGPTAAWRTAGFMDGETATLRQGQAIDDDDEPRLWFQHTVTFYSIDTKIWVFQDYPQKFQFTKLSLDFVTKYA